MRTLPAGMATELAKRFPGSARLNLFDIQRGDGAQFFWADFEGQFLSKLTGAVQQYKPWIKDAPTVKLTRSLQADGGEFTLQNLSGNLTDREVSSALVAGEFEGAYVVYRPWIIPLDAAVWEFHGSLSEQSDGSADLTFRMLQLFQPNEIPAYEQLQTRACHWRFTSAQCGYRRGQLFVPSTTATIHTSSTIGASSLALTPNLFKDELVMIVSGTGAGQERYILSHTATTFTMKTNWTTAPDGTSKFIVTGPGAMKLALQVPNIFSGNTIGNSGLARTVNGDVDASVFILLGNGAGQNRAIASNTATTFTISPAWSTVPDATSSFIVVYNSCANDRDSCVTRGVTERFPGLIFLQPQITAVNGPTGVGTGGGSGPSSGGPGAGGPPGGHGRLGLV